MMLCAKIKAVNQRFKCRLIKKVCCLSCVFILVTLICATDAFAASWYWPFPESNGLNADYASHNYEGVDVNVPAWSEIYSPTDGVISNVFTGCNHHSGLSYGGTCEEAGECVSGNYSRFNDITYGFCNNGFGNGVVIHTDDGYTVQFAHMNQVAPGLYNGQRITKDTFLGYAGDTGCATGVHCHYAISQGSNYWENFIDPMSMNYLSRDIVLVAGGEMTSGYDRCLPDGDYVIATAATGDKNSFYFIDIVGGVAPAANESNVALYGPAAEPSAISSHDIWTIHYSDGFYTIKQKGSEMAMDVNDASIYAPANIWTYEANGSSAQKFAIKWNGRNGYRIQPKCSGFALDISGVYAVSGANIYQAEVTDGPSQAWLFIPYAPAQPLDGGEYILVNNPQSEEVLGITGTSGLAGSNKQAVTMVQGGAASENCVFDVVKLSNGNYSINWNHQVNNNAFSGSLGVDGGDSVSGTPVSILPSQGINLQQWIISGDNQSGYTIQSVSSGLAMDANGSAVTQKPIDGSNAQKWFFKDTHYTISYDANGGTSAPAAQTKTFNGEVLITSTEPVRSGYLFTGWNTSADGKGVDYRPGDSYRDNSSMVLYAQWSLTDQYTYVDVNALLDGRSATDTEDYGTFDVYIDDILDASGVTEYRRTLPNGTAFRVDNIQPKDGVFCARRECTNLTGVLDGGSVQPVISFRTGVEPTSEWQECTELPQNITSETSEIQYLNHYNVRESENSPGEGWVRGKSTTTYVNGNVLYSPDPEPLQTSDTLVYIGTYYYHFCDGSDAVEHYWTERFNHETVLDNNGQFEIVWQGADDADPRYTVYRLKWISGEYAGALATCSYGSSAPMSLYYQGYRYQQRTAVTTYQWTKEDVWAMEPDSNADSVTYRFRLKSYPVEYDANGGESAPEAQTKFCTVDLDITEALPVRDGWSFFGWNTMPDGSGIAYAPGDVYSEDTAITLYAQWMPIVKLQLPAGTTRIEAHAFDHIGAYIIEIPDGCTSIGDGAFANNAELVQIYIPASVTSIAFDAFEGCEKITIYAPENSRAISMAKTLNLKYEIITE